MTTPAIMTPLLQEPRGRDADVETIWRQIPVWTWIAMGARRSRMVAHPDALQAEIFLGAGTVPRRLVIKLNGKDLYDVELGRIVRHRRPALPEYWVVEQLRDIDAENLDATVRALYDRHHI